MRAHRGRTRGMGAAWERSGWSSGSSESSSSSSSQGSGHEADVEDSGAEEEDYELGDAWDEDGLMNGNPSQHVRSYVESLYANRYQVPRERIPRPEQPFLDHVLTVYKTARPDLFRQELRITPWTFDQLLAALIDDPIFANDSQNSQFPVERQLAIALWRFGHYGNAVGLQKVANWAGVGKGYVLLATRRVIAALTRPDFVVANIRMPTEEEKEEAKEWVETHSCRAWRHGWCLVDGTLVPLFVRPHWFGESYFDRKCNYSLNVQVRCPF